MSKYIQLDKKYRILYKSKKMMMIIIKYRINHLKK